MLKMSLLVMAQTLPLRLLWWPRPLNLMTLLSINNLLKVRLRKLQRRNPPRLNYHRSMMLWLRSSLKIKRWHLTKAILKIKQPNLPQKKLQHPSKLKRMPKLKDCQSQMSFHLMIQILVVLHKRLLIRNKLKKAFTIKLYRLKFSTKLIQRLKLVLIASFLFKSKFNKLKSSNKL